jgi:hypothetical protein
MGAAYEILSTPIAYAMPAYYDRHKPALAHKPVRVPFGAERLQSFVYWEPATVAHSAVVMWFHGGGYLVGTPESMANAADAYLSQGYRFVSVGFRLMPRAPFPAQIQDAFIGVKAAAAWLQSETSWHGGIIVGGSSAGGMSAALLSYGRLLQRHFGLDAADIAQRICGYVSCAAVLDADDMLLDYAPSGAVGDALLRAGIKLPATSARGGRIDRALLHDELRAYSPIALLDQEDVPAVPYFGIHGVADATSPFATESAFAKRISERLGPEAATLRAIGNRRWQHMVTTVTMYKRHVEEDPLLSELFLWLGAHDS